MSRVGTGTPAFHEKLCYRVEGDLCPGMSVCVRAESVHVRAALLGTVAQWAPWGSHQPYHPTPA